MKNQKIVFTKKIKNNKDGVSALFIQKVLDAQKKTLSLEIRK